MRVATDGNDEPDVDEPDACVAAGEHRLRLVPGPHLAGLSDASLAALFAATWRMSPASDRVGMRLAGPRLAWTGAEPASQGVLPGALQLPPDGQPIILGWDGPVTGGYPVIGGVIGADLGRLAQIRPGETVRLQAVGPEEARRLWHERQAWAGVADAH
jgi:allophanate hydrolase subunit 2